MTEQWTVSTPEKLTFDAEITRLRVRTVAGAVNVVADDGPARLEVTEIEGPPLQITLERGELVVTYDDLTWKDFSWKSLATFIGKWREGVRRRAVVSLAVPHGTRIELGSASSDTVISGIAAPVTVHSASGSTTLVGVSGPVDANTVSGSVHAQSVSGDLKVNTVSGELTVVEGASRTLKANSVSGPVTVDLARNNNTDVSLNNVSGEVSLRIPEPTNAQVHANTTSGDVSSAFDELRMAGTWGAKQLTGTLGTGSGKVKITTVSGSVALLRRPAPEDDTPKALDFSKEDEA
ncbi:DUF4097 family beta strand repeat-containing protein [Streptacidiphilus carbonis]|jgi:hypothetical protein|uniref:DUF4097 family beta strand repeat-containing protein n=1 Tax=Streptacidiphilus carbonis TaxID=105422 RepID=UPI0005A6B522|nr:DUF4097 family beta strand repeat-containing protein [Streptacidiphilus carbonis]